MTTKITTTAIDVGESAANHHAAINEAHRRISEADKVMTRHILDAREMPHPSNLHQQATYASDLIEAAQAYRRDLLKLLALAGGYDKEG